MKPFVEKSWIFTEFHRGTVSVELLLSPVSKETHEITHPNEYYTVLRGLVWSPAQVRLCRRKEPGRGSDDKSPSLLLR